MSSLGFFARLTTPKRDLFLMPGFMKLPRELRDLVYAFVPVPNEPMILRDAHDARLTGDEPRPQYDARLGAEMLRGLRAEDNLGLLFASRQLAREAAPALLARNAWCFDCPTGDWRPLNAFLRALGPTNVGYLRTLQVDVALPSGPAAVSVDAMRPEFEALFRTLADHGRDVHLIIETQDFVGGQFGQNWGRALQYAVNTNQRLAGVDEQGRERVKVSWRGFSWVRPA